MTEGTHVPSKGKMTVETQIDGHIVKLSFAEEFNPTAGQYVKNALIDAFIRRNNIQSEIAA